MLPWWEAGAKIVLIGLSSNGDLDYEELKTKLEEYWNYQGLKIGTFTACSNITGLLLDADYIAFLLHSFGFLAFFDYAAGAPYIKINMMSGSSKWLDQAS